MRPPTLPPFQIFTNIIDVVTLGRFKGIKITLNLPYIGIKKTHILWLKELMIDNVKYLFPYKRKANSELYFAY